MDARVLFFKRLFWCVLSGVNVMLRKIAVAAASKPSVEITQDGETLSIKTSTSVRTTHVNFTVGHEFNEATVDGRPCTVNTHPYKNTSDVIQHLSICVFLFQNIQKTKNLLNVCVCIWCGLNHTLHLRGAIKLDTHPFLQPPPLELTFSWALICFSLILSFLQSHIKKRPTLYIFVCLYFPQSFPHWETDSKISCEQTLQKGEGPKTSWTREITNDGELILVRFIPIIMCYPYDSYTHIGLWSYFFF